MHVGSAVPQVKSVRWFWFMVPAAPASVLTLISAVFPGGSLYVLAYALLFWLLTAGGWGLLLTLPPYRRSPGIVLPPLIAVTTYMTVAADLPIRAAFALSEPALTDYVRSLPLRPEHVTAADGDGGLGVEWVGAFPVGRAVRHADKADLGVIGSGGWMEFCGLTYVNGDRLGEVRFSSVARLSENWYATCENF